MGRGLALLLCLVSVDAGQWPASQPKSALGPASPASELTGLPELERAAKKGDAAAQFRLGDAYWAGRGVRHDDAEAVRWFSKAAARGNAAAEFGLGFAYDLGHGVPQDEAQAAYWYKKALQHGVLEWRRNLAQFRLGYLYGHGEGVPQDDAEAVRWFKQVAARGECVAQFNLAVAYYQGKGVVQDYRDAYFWANLAAACAQRTLSRDFATEYASFRDTAAAKLGRAQLLAVQKRCRQWMDAFEKRKAQDRGKTSREEGAPRRP